MTEQETMDLLDELMQETKRQMITDQTVALLEAEGFSVRRTKDQPFFAVQVGSAQGDWVLAGRAFPDGGGMACYSVLQKKVAPDRRPGLLEWMNAANEQLYFGSFELTEAGEVRFRTSVRFGDQEPDDDLLREVVYRNLELMDGHLSSLRDLL